MSRSKVRKWEPWSGLVARLEEAAWLDPAVLRLRATVEAMLRSRRLEDVLHGVPLGHPLHPVAVQLPLGAWTSAAILDLLPGTRASSGVLVGVGVAGALPAVMSGATDWARLHEQQQRVGLAHLAINATATGLYAASLLQRLKGRRTKGKALSYLGFGTVMIGGYLGGHIAFRQAAGANHVEDVPHRVAAGWQPLCPLAELDEGRLTQRTLGQVPLVILRRGPQVDVLSGLCSHLSGPLWDGALLESTSGTCVKCPWHGSVFSLETGAVVHGPATSPGVRFASRIADGMVEVRIDAAG
jgi:nitrite reductase/ring-hydroxylating ferredoxin subunit/uncharacterized membrane protein